MGWRYETTNRGKDEEVARSTHISQSIWAREKGRHETYLSIKFRGRGGEIFQLLRTFFPESETKCFNFHETYMFRIKREHISERASDGVG